MDLILLVFALSVIGCVVWLITTKIPMDPTFKLAIQIIVLIVVVLYLLRRFGGGIPNLM